MVDSRGRIGDGDGVKRATVSAYMLMALLILAAATSFMTVLYGREGAALAKERERADQAMQQIRAHLRTGDRLPSTRIAAVADARIDNSESLAARYDFIYIFSPECPVCRSIDPVIKRASARLRVAWVSTKPGEGTRRYADSLGLGQDIWTVDSVAQFLVPGTPTLVRVSQTPRGAVVENVASGQRGVSFLLSRESAVDSASHATLEQLAVTRRW